MNKTILPLLIALVLMGLPGRLDAEAEPLQFDPAWDYSLLAAGAVAAGSGFILENRLADRTYDPALYDRRDVPAYDGWAIGFYSKPLSNASDFLVLALGSAPLVQAGMDLHQGRESWRECWGSLVVYGEVVAFASAAGFYSKTLRIHPRPLAFTDKAPLSERRTGDAHSGFFSVHTTGAFAAATFLGSAYSLEHPASAWTPWIWTGGLGLAAGVGALRILSGSHFPSDVLAGAVLGSAIGYGIPRLHRKNPGSHAGSKEPAGFIRSIETGLRFYDSGLAPVIALRF